MSRCPTPDKQRECAAVSREVIGLLEHVGVILIAERGFTSRIRSRDGKNYMGTCDFRMDRINLNITDGKIVRAGPG